MRSSVGSWQAASSLPDGYVQLDRIDLAQKKQMKSVLWLSLAMIVPWLALGIGLSPVLTLRQLVQDPLLHGLAVVLGMIVYIPGHEAVHGVLMWGISHVHCFGPADCMGNRAGGSGAAAAGKLVLADMDGAADEHDRRDWRPVCGLACRAYAGNGSGAGYGRGYDRIWVPGWMNLQAVFHLSCGYATPQGRFFA